MTNHNIDNSLNNLGKSVLWQYDKAVRLLALMKHMQVMFHISVERFWEFWREKVLSIENCGAFGCYLWGMFLGVPRPTIVEDDTGKERSIAISVYRKILKGAFYLMKANSSFNDIVGYLEIVFGVSGNDSLSVWKLDSGLEYGWYTNIDEINGKYEPHREYSKGYVFWYDPNNNGVGSNWKCKEDIPANANTSWDDLRNGHLIVETIERTTYSRRNSTLILKLYDPEGICRGIGGAPNDALSISATYIFGETTITATATRKRKCGVVVVDNGDMTMTYAKSAYYSAMHKDQQYLFEQKLDKFCPYPLGIKTNKVINPIVFWPDTSNADKAYDAAYAPNTAYAKDTRIKFTLGNEEIGILIGSYHNFPLSVIVPDVRRIITVKGKVYVIGVAKRAITSEENTDIYSLIKSLVPSQIGTSKGTYGQNLVNVVELWGENDGSAMLLYAENTAYEWFEGFCVAQSDGYTKVYVAKQDISSAENTSLESIADKIEEVDWETLFPGSIADGIPPYIDYSARNRFMNYNNPDLLLSFSTHQMVLVKDKAGFRYVLVKTTTGRMSVQVLRKGATYQKQEYVHYLEVESDDADTVMEALAEFLPQIGYTDRLTVDQAMEWPTSTRQIVYEAGAIVKIDGEWRRSLQDFSAWAGLNYDQASKARFKQISVPLSQTCIARHSSLDEYQTYAYRSSSYRTNS